MYSNRVFNSYLIEKYSSEIHKNKDSYKNFEKKDQLIIHFLEEWDGPESEHQNKVIEFLKNYVKCHRKVSYELVESILFKFSKIRTREKMIFLEQKKIEKNKKEEQKKKENEYINQKIINYNQKIKESLKGGCK